MPISISGSQITFNDSTVQSSSGATFGTTWTNVTGDRAFGVTYTNTTGKHIQVIVGASTYYVGGGVIITVNGVSLPPIWAYSGAVGTASACVIVPPGATYAATDYGYIQDPRTWFELR